MLSVKKAGMQVLFECQDALRRLNALDEVAAQAESYTIGKLKGRVPTLVSAAVAKVYQIDKNDVARAHKTKASIKKLKNPPKGSAHLRTSFRGTDLSSMEVIFTGRKRSTWNTTATPMPAPVGSGKTFSTKEKYAVTRTVYRNQPVTLKGNKNYRIFVINRKGQLLPLAVGKKGRKPLAMAATSVPQAVMNQDVVHIWRPKLNDFTLKTFNTRLKYLSDKI